MAFKGRFDWDGPDPDVMHLIENGERKVAMSLAHRGMELVFVIRDVDTLIRDLEAVRAWTDGEK